MRVALIPPFQFLRHIDKTDIQLVLPHLLANEEYGFAYNGLGENIRTILDNGAAEGEELPTTKYMDLIEKFLPWEFALPDVLADHEATVKRSKTFLHDNQNRIRATAAGVGIVAQGTSVNEALATVNRVMASSLAELITVVYIPRLLLAASGNKYARIQVAAELCGKWGDRLDIHFFGASSMWPQEIKVATKYDYIRSIDTSLPYVYAWHGIELTARTVRGCNRPPLYFTEQWLFEELVEKNVKTFLHWSDGA